MRLFGEAFKGLSQRIYHCILSINIYNIRVRLTGTNRQWFSLEMFRKLGRTLTLWMFTVGANITDAPRNFASAAKSWLPTCAMRRVSQVAPSAVEDFPKMRIKASNQPHISSSRPEYAHGETFGWSAHKEAISPNAIRAVRDLK